MSNMSYCRFENTYNDLSDCAGALQEPDEGKLSDSERRARRHLIEMCMEIVENFGDMTDDDLDKMAPRYEEEEVA